MLAAHPYFRATLIVVSLGFSRPSVLVIRAGFFMSYSREDLLGALGEHGAFFKKAVFNQLKSTLAPFEKREITEEYPTLYTRPQTLDIIASFAPSGDRRIYFTVECKKVYKKDWVFVQASLNCYRKWRTVSSLGFGNSMFGSDTADYVASEGFELSYKPAKNADQPKTRELKLSADPNPIFEAGQQLANGYLGFLEYLNAQYSLAGAASKQAPQTNVVPIIVTNAHLFFQPVDPGLIFLSSGSSGNQCDAKEVPWVVLNQPLASLGRSDFRNLRTTTADAEHGHAQFQESIYIVNGESLDSFISSRVFF